MERCRAGAETWSQPQVGSVPDFGLEMGHAECRRPIPTLPSPPGEDSAAKPHRDALARGALPKLVSTAPFAVSRTTTSFPGRRLAAMTLLPLAGSAAITLPLSIPPGAGSSVAYDVSGTPRAE